MMKRKRFCALLLCALLFGVGYFTQFRAKKLLLNLGSGVLLAVLITLLGGQVDTCLTRVGQPQYAAPLEYPDR